MRHSFLCLCGDSAKKILGSSFRAEVIAVHSESVYIRTQSGEILLLCGDKYGVVPFGVSSVDFQTIKDLRGYTVGEPVDIESFALRFSDGTVIEISEREYKYPQLQQTELPSKEAILFSYEYIDGRASSRGIGTVLGTLVGIDRPRDDSNAFAGIVASLADSFENALLSLDQAGVDGCVKKLVGLGYGLTPSGDDFLCGMLYAFDRLSRACATSGEYKSILSKAVSDHLSGTSIVSARYLQSAVMAEHFEVIDGYISSLCSYSGKDDIGELYRSIDLMLSVGASSGSDIMCGILFASYILM